MVPCHTAALFIFLSPYIFVFMVSSLYRDNIHPCNEELMDVTCKLSSCLEIFFKFKLNALLCFPSRTQQKVLKSCQVKAIASFASLRRRFFFLSTALVSNLCEDNLNRNKYMFRDNLCCLSRNCACHKAAKKGYSLITYISLKQDRDKWTTSQGSFLS